METTDFLQFPFRNRETEENGRDRRLQTQNNFCLLFWWCETTDEIAE